MALAKRKRAQVQPEVVIPEKIYFRIGEVSELANLPTYVLRFWETEFSQLKPTKSSTGQRMYRRKDVESVMRIRRLLYEEGFTIAGAREKLKEEARAQRSPAVAAVPAPQLAAAPARGAKKQPAPLPLIAAMETATRKEELLRLRQQLSDVLALLT